MRIIKQSQYIARILKLLFLSMFERLQAKSDKLQEIIFLLIFSYFAQFLSLFIVNYWIILHL